MARVSVSTLSTPFWRGTTTVFGPISGFKSAVADCVSYSLTVNKTTSAGPIDAGLSVAFTVATRTSPSGLWMLRPFFRSAFRCAPRATNDTSAPHAARRPPKYPPTPPLPNTAIRMSRQILALLPATLMRQLLRRTGRLGRRQHEDISFRILEEIGRASCREEGRI